MSEFEIQIKGLLSAGKVLAAAGRSTSEIDLCQSALNLNETEATWRALYWASIRGNKFVLADSCLNRLEAAAGTDRVKLSWVAKARQQCLEQRRYLELPADVALYDWNAAAEWTSPDRKSRAQALARQYNLTEKDVVVGYVGSIHALEGLEILNAACAELVQRGHPIKLLVIDDEPASVASLRTSGDAGGEALANPVKQPAESPSWYRRAVPATANQKADLLEFVDVVVVPRDTIPTLEDLTPVSLGQFIEMGKPILVPDTAPFVDYARRHSKVSTFVCGDAASLARRLDQEIKQRKVRAVVARHPNISARRNVLRVGLHADLFTVSQLAAIAARFKTLKARVTGVTLQVVSAKLSADIAEIWRNCEGSHYSISSIADPKAHDFLVVPEATTEDSANGSVAIIPAEMFGGFCDILETLTGPHPADAIYFAYTEPDNLKNGYHKRTKNLTACFAPMGFFVPVMSFRSDRYCVQDGVAFVPDQDAVIRRLLQWMRPVRVIAASNHVNASRVLEFREEVGFEFIYEMRGLWHETFAAKMKELNPRHDLQKDAFYQKGRNAELEAVRRSDKVVFISPEMRDYIVSDIPDRALVHHIACNGAAPTKALRKNAFRRANSPFVIGYFGSITYYEGIRLLLEAIKELRAEGLPTLEVLLIGNNSITQKWVLDLDAYDFLTYETFKDNIQREYKRVNLFVIPRLPYTVCHTVEPLKPIEYFAAGLPVLMSDCAALNRIAQSGENCPTFAAGNKDALKASIRAIYENGYPLDKLESAFEYVRKTRSWPRVAADYAGFLGFGTREKVYFLYGDKWWISAKWSGATVNLINEMIMMSARREVYYNDVYVNDLISPDGVFDEDTFRERCSRELGKRDRKRSRILDNIILPSRNYVAIFHRAGSGENVVKFFREELPEPKIYSHNFVHEIWQHERVGFQNETSRMLAQSGLLRELDDDGTLGYGNIDVVPTKSFVRYQGCVTQRQDLDSLKKLARKKGLRQLLNSEFVIGVIGTIYEGTYPDSLLAVVRQLRARYPEKNITVVFYTINVLKDLPQEDWIHVTSFDKRDQAWALAQLDVIVNTWKAYPQIFSGSNKNLDAVNFGIPLITARTPSYVEQLGAEYPLFLDFENVDHRLSAKTEHRLAYLLEACFSADFRADVRSYLLYQREAVSGGVVADLYDQQIRALNRRKVLLVAQNFDVGGVQKYSTHVLQAVSNCHVTLAVQEPVSQVRLTRLRQICPRLKVVYLNNYDFSDERFDVAFLNSHPTDAAELTRLTQALHANGARIYPIVHTDIHTFTREIADKIDIYSGIITVADIIAQKLSANTGRDVTGKSHLITPVLDADTAPNHYAAPKTARSRKIGYFGRIVSIKGIEFLVRSFARYITETSHDYELHIYGPVAQPYLGKYISRMEESEGKGFVFLHNEEIGPEDRVAILRGLDALVYTTAMDGLPYTFLEAMEQGVPVLSTAVGGINHLIKDGYNGLIFNFEGLFVEDLNDPEPYKRLLQTMKDKNEVYYSEFAQVMTRFISDDALFLAMSKNAIVDVNERFSNTALIKKIKAIVYTETASE